MPPDSQNLDQQALQRLQQISAEILGQLDLDPLLASIMTGAADLLDASQINLYRYVPSRDLLETWIHLRAPEGVTWIEHRRGDGVAGRVLQTGRGLRIDDYDHWEGRSTQWPTGVTGPGMAAPIRRSEELLGVITVARPPHSRLFTEADLTLLQLFANQAAVAIANAQLYAGVSRKADELSKLYDTSLDIVSQLDLESVLQATLERATNLLDCSANLRLHDPEQDMLVPLLPLKQPQDIAYALLRPTEGLSGRVFTTGEPLIVNDYDHWEGRSPQYPPGVIGRSMAAPLRQGDQIIGVLALNRTSDGLPFTGDDLQLLSLFANQASVAITNARLYADSRLQSQELGHLYETSLDITGRLDLNDLLDAVIRRTSALIQAQQGEILLYDAERDVTTAFLSLGLDEAGLPTDIHSVGLPPDGLDGLVIHSRRAVRLDDYQQWPGRLKTPGPATMGPMLGVPIVHRGQILGSFSLARAPGAPPFRDQDERRLTLFANQAAVAIANARQVEQLESFHAQQVEKERLDQQVRTAQAVQAGLLPLQLPVVPGWDIAALWRPALQLGGDYYDFIPLGLDRWACVMGDVSDKGIPAALLMASARSLFHAYAAPDLRPSLVLERVNHDLVATSHSGMFVTAVYAVVDASTGVIQLSAAGHPPPLLIRHPGREVRVIKLRGLPLGILEEAPFQDETVNLQPGERIVFYTDGVTEATSLTRELFGASRLEAFLAHFASGSSGQLIDGLDLAVRDFVGAHPQSDDVAYLTLRRET
ncbi:MAG TPA: GAF domain-containing SpoIIE family protein phosphatase [Anaerolineales bacterium]|nr:GAF domain-containing SpoIIE family protein phosphatase [Anaerolineales bacterium]